VQSLLAPGIAAVFMLGIFSRRVTPNSGLVGLAFGFVFGMSRLALQIMDKSFDFTLPGFLQVIVDINWLYFSFILFALTCLVIFAVSMVTPKASIEQLAGLTYRSVTADQNERDRQTYGFWEVFHTCVILGIVAAIYLYFW